MSDTFGGYPPQDGGSKDRIPLREIRTLLREKGCKKDSCDSFIKKVIGEDVWLERMNGEPLPGLPARASCVWVSQQELEKIVEWVSRPGGPLDRDKPQLIEPEVRDSDTEIWLELDNENLKADLIKSQEETIAGLRQQLKDSQTNELLALRDAVEAHRAAAAALEAHAETHRQIAAYHEERISNPLGE